ncbi:MAG: hypothetical protein AAFX40_10630 [Cyanobacteria bacterium J06639_1]
MENNAVVTATQLPLADTGASGSRESDRGRRHMKVFEKTYSSNIESDYTEQMDALCKSFKYEENSDIYWGNPELSLLHGTPLYEQTTESQRLALNHLFWVGQYNHTAATEANTCLYNQVTEGVFRTMSGYDTLCKELDLETEQEHTHIRTFQKVGYKVKLALLGKKGLGDPRRSAAKLNQTASKQTKALDTAVAMLGQPTSDAIEAASDRAFRLVTRWMNNSYADNYSEYLQERDRGDSVIPGTTGGLGGLVSQGSLQKFFTLNWGSSPFLASQYFAIRMIGNMSLKCYEQHYFKYFRKLRKQGDRIAAPTEISYYHMLDESFHTTFSQFIAQELWTDFPEPTPYERLLVNLTVDMAQKNVVGGLSGVMPTVFRRDSYFELLLFRLLKSPVFDMSDRDALHWIQRCLCEEHDGFHSNREHHRRLLVEFRRFFEPMTFLWASNRTMQVMAEGGSIERALQCNKDSFERFAKSVAS